MRYSMSPCSRSTLQIPLMWWIGANLLLMWMEPSRNDRYVSWIVGTGFARQDCEASEGVMAVQRSGGGNMGTRKHYAC